MTKPGIPDQDPSQLPPVDSIHSRIINYTSGSTLRWLLIDTTGQALYQVRDRDILSLWPVSTATVGLNNRDSSGGTPPGVHRIAQKIGTDAPVGTVFDSRKPTGETWDPQWNEQPERLEKDLILSRILVLEGLEPGVNQGPGVDSRQRFIYIHGTNREDLIGQAVSHGCIRMNNHHMIDLFDRVAEGDLLVII